MFVVELTLTKAEVAIALDALGHSSLIGMPVDAFKFSDEKKREVATTGAKGLIEKDLAAADEDGTLALDADLLTIVKVAADAELAMVIVKDIPATGKQLIVHAAMNNAVVEHTRPTADTHRLAVLRDQTDLPARWAEIFPLKQQPVNAQLHSSLENFPKIVSLANAGSFADAVRLFPIGAPKSLSEQLVKDMHSPRYSANVSFIWREDGVITDGCNIMILSGATTDWLVAQKQPGAPDLVIKCVNDETCLMEMVELWKSLAEANA